MTHGRTRTSVLERHRVTQAGLVDGPPMVFGNGVGCDQARWQLVASAFTGDHRVVLFDHVGWDGVGGSDLSGYSPDRYDSLGRYAGDVLEVYRALGLADSVFVGHGVGALIGTLAAVRSPELFATVVLVVAAPPSGLDGEFRVGALHRADLAALRESLPRPGPDDAPDLDGVPVAVGDFLHRHLADGDPVRLGSTGRYPDLTAPQETVAAIRAVLGS